MNEVMVQRCKQPVERQVAARKRRTQEAGQALLELALLLPMLCLLVIGILDLGQAAAVTIAVNNAATAGVEYGSQNGTTASDTNGMQNVATNDTKGNNIPTGMTAAATYGCQCDTGNGVSCIYPVPAPGTCSTILAACPNGTPVECVQVLTQLTFYPFLNYPGVPMSYQANGRAVMRVRQ